MSVDFDKIFHELNPTPGILRLQQGGLGWKSADNLVTIAADDISYMQWMSTINRVARNFQLKIGLKSEKERQTFDGLVRDDYERLSKTVKEFYGVTLETREISFRGWNWGRTEYRGSDLSFQVSGRTMFEIPVQKIANSNIASKTEVSLEFIDPTASAQGEPTSGPSSSRRADELVEMRFYIPNSSKARGFIGDNDDDDSKSQKSDQEEQSVAQLFHDQIKDKAEIGKVSGDGLVVFNDILVVTPRGRYEIDMYPTFIRLRGKTYDYKILYSSIKRLFVLPKTDDMHVLLVVGLDPPIRQGQTRYPYITMQFPNNEELDATINMEESEIQEKYGDRLQKHYDAPAYQVVAQVFRGLSGKDITTPKTFKSFANQPAIKCNVKANQGDLYVMEKSLFFVTKQPIYIPFSDIQSAQFARVGGAISSSRTFDLRIVQKSGTENVFSGINREEHEPLEEFFTNKKIKTKNNLNEDLIGAPIQIQEESDSEMDEDDKRASKANVGQRDEDDESEEDEDFEASSSDEGSPSEASSDEEEDDDGDKKMSKKSKDSEGPPKKKARKEKSDEVVQMDSD
ncbi:SSrecog-domain-containing protein [Wallemia mellicola]|nr:SSrecog-domain-containing protein [Wallemia mellicola]